MGDRDAGRCGRRGRGRDSRHDLEVQASGGQRGRLLTTAAEDERVAALQPDGLEPGAAEADEQVVDRLLGQPLARDAERVLRRLGNELGRDEGVVDHRVAGAKAGQAADRDQLGVAGAGADEVDRHPSACFTSPSK